MLRVAASLAVELALADSDAAHERLLTTRCWPALLGILDQQPRDPARAEHIHRLALLGQHSEGHSEWHSPTVRLGSTLKGRPDADQTPGAEPIGAAAAVAQLITALLQGSPAAEAHLAQSPAFLQALLRCYSQHAPAVAAAPVPPVQPAAAAARRALCRMLRAVCDAAVGLLLRLDLTPAMLRGVLGALPLASAAASLHAAGNTVPTALRLASCRLLSTLFVSQGLADCSLNHADGG